MPRKFKSLLFLFICIIALLPIRAKAAETNNVKDYLNYLSETEVQNLQSKINEISNKYNLDTVIVITDNTDGKSSMQYADDFYDKNNYGLDAEKSGILMLINMNAREVWISTKGSAITIFTDSTISAMVKDITKYLSDKDYNGASNKFLENCDKKLTANKTDSTGNSSSESSSDAEKNSAPTSYSSRVNSRVTSLSTYIIPLIISIVVTFIVTQKSKWEVTTNSRTYEGNDSFNLTNRKDTLINEKTTKTKIVKESNDTSTTHKSSSKETHGGGGGSF